MATYTIRKSWAYPERKMEGEDLAIRAIRQQRAKPELWGHIEGRDGRIDPCCSNKAWMSLMYFPEVDDGEWLARPSILIQTFHARKTTIHAVCLSIPVVQDIKSGPDTTVFLTEDDLGLRVAIQAHGTRTVNEEIFVELDVLGIGPGKYKFTYDDPAWPWPILYPQKFAGLMQLGNILLPEDSNPLTGLCRAASGTHRSLAKALAQKLKETYKQTARDIVSLL